MEKKKNIYIYIYIIKQTNIIQEGVVIVANRKLARERDKKLTAGNKSSPKHFSY